MAITHFIQSSISPTTNNQVFHQSGYEAYLVEQRPEQAARDYHDDQSKRPIITNLCFYLLVILIRWDFTVGE